MSWQNGGGGVDVLGVQTNYPFKFVTSSQLETPSVGNLGSIARKRINCIVPEVKTRSMWICFALTDDAYFLYQYILEAPGLHPAQPGRGNSAHPFCHVNLHDIDLYLEKVPPWLNFG
jgi:hypothetical protein